MLQIKNNKPHLAGVMLMIPRKKEEEKEIFTFYLLGIDGNFKEDV
jgi:hypothetical protein